MTSKIVVFGATGYTGEQTARELVARGARPVLAGRSAERLEALAADLGGLPTQVADVNRPESVAELVEAGDVLVSTVGPFTRWGAPAVQAAIARGAWYLDSTGEPPFIRRVFEDVRAAGGSRRDRPGDGVRLRLGSRQPGRRARAGGRRAGRGQRRHRLLHARTGRDQRRHPRQHGPVRARRRLRLPGGRLRTERMGARVTRVHPRQRQGALRRQRGHLRALRAAAAAPHPARRQRGPRAGAAADAGGPRWPPACWTRR